EFFHFAPNAFFRQVGYVDGLAEFGGFGCDLEFEPGGELCGAKHTQRILGERRVRNVPQTFVADIFAATEWIDDLAGQRVFQYRVHREITPRTRLFERHIRVAFDDETTMSASGFSFTTGQTHVQ